MILHIDLALWTLVLCVNAVGYWLMRTKAREWAVPVNVILGYISVSLASAWGMLTMGFGFSAILSYGIPNGLVAWGCATVGYDYIHEHVKKKESWLSVWKSFLGIFKKKEAKA